MRDEFGIACCDYCGVDQGEFEEASGNHPICNKLTETMLELEENSYDLKIANARIATLETALGKITSIFTSFTAKEMRKIAEEALATPAKG